ncbi:MAG: T9SS type A sorting domain-containing protein [Bacteroidetes bacterium]|nr:T9SS type A sorting domain-containing protein [Bacteroidota bacterium]MBL7112283.1 T9SS type A sorting domain-containing protein [Bacteroidales bacterium]
MKSILIGVTCVLILLNAGRAIGQDIIINVPVSQPRLLELDAGENSLVEDPGTIILGQDITVIGGAPEYTYSWTDPDKNVFEGQSISGTTFGKYFLVVTDVNNCTSLDSVYIYNSTSVLSQIVDNPLVVFPNPATGTLRFSTQSFSSPVKVDIFSIEGKKVLSKEILNAAESDFHYMNLGELEQGVYIIKLDDGHFYRMESFILN